MQAQDTTLDPVPTPEEWETFLAESADWHDSQPIVDQPESVWYRHERERMEREYAYYLRTARVVR